MAIKLFINEPDGLTDQTFRLFYADQTSFNLIMGQRGTASLPLRAQPWDDYTPTIGCQVFLYDPDTYRAYAGTIDNFEQRWIGNDGWRVYTCTCVSLDQVFDTIRVPPTAYFGETAGAIFTDLYNTYAAPLSVPVALGTVQDGPVVDSFVVRWDRLSDLFQKLATLAQFITGVEMQGLTLYFQAPATTPAPFVLQKFLWETGDWKQERSDFRDRQLIQISFTAFSTSNEMFAGDGEAGFIDLFRRIDRISSACITTSTQATAMGIFGAGSPLVAAQPSPGDTFRIGPVGEEPYTFVTALDNTLRNLILIGATVNDTAVNTFHAIQGTQIWKGIKFSLPTWENDQCNADFPVDNVFTLRCKNPGSGGNGILLTTTSATFSWSAGATTGGTDGVSNALRCGILGAGDTGNDILYVSGSNSLSLAAPIEIGSSLSVAYYALGADTIAVENSALVALRASVEHGSGRYDQQITDTNNTDAVAAYVQAVNALEAFETLPKSFTFSIDDAELSPGQLLTIAVLAPGGAPVLLDGVWLVHEIQATLIPGMELLAEPYGHFRYTVTVINVTVIGTFIDFYQNLAIITPAGSQSASSGNTAIQTATPTLKNPATAVPGSPTAGTPATPAGQQWVQEAPGPYRQWKAKDLKVDASDDTVVSSTSHTFVSGDVGSTVTVTGGVSWTPGAYPIVSVLAGAATLGSSPAAVSTAHGEWELSSGKIYSLSWTPLASSYTHNQIVILTKNGLELSPFAPHTPGYVASGGDYEIANKNQILFSDDAAPDPTSDTLVATYFPSGIVKEPDGPVAPDSGALVAIARSSSGTDQIMTGDGTSFDGVSSPTDNQGGNTIFSDGAGNIVALALGSDGTTWIAIKSTDAGATWVSNSVPQPSGEFVDLTWGGGMWVGLADSGEVITSSDGETWTLASTLGGSLQYSSITFGLGLYIACGIGLIGDDVIFRSADAVAWTASATSTTDQNARPQSVCFDGSGQFVCVCLPFLEVSIPSWWTSTDGETWTPHFDLSIDNFTTVAFGNGVYVSPGNGSDVMTSEDGLIWTLTFPTLDFTLTGRIRFLDTQFFVANKDGDPALAVSTDGLVWSQLSTPLDNATDIASAASVS